MIRKTLKLYLKNKEGKYLKHQKENVPHTCIKKLQCHKFHVKRPDRSRDVILPSTWRQVVDFN